jgi:hypothetical protein
MTGTAGTASSARNPAATGAEAQPAGGIPVSWLIAAMFALLAMPNLLLWRFLGIESVWAYALGMAAFAFLVVAASQAWAGGAGARVGYRVLAFSAVVAAVLLLLGGEGRIFYANYDWQVRDAVLRDLIVNPWPFVYTDRGAPELLRAPLGMYLIPAVLAKALGASSAGWVLLIQNLVLTTAFLAVASRLFDTMKAALWALAIFVMFSGMDILGVLLMASHYGGFYGDDHIEFWSGFQYSSHITQIFWVPMHALVGWIGALLFLLWKQEKLRVELLLAAVPVLALWSPLAAMGVVPFAAYAGLADLFGKRIALSTILPPAVAVLFTLSTLAYLVAGSGSVGIRPNVFGPSRYVVFILLEVAPYLAAVLILTPRPRWGGATLALTAACLLLMPFLQIGESQDFVMRASIPALAILALLVAEAFPNVATKDLSLPRRMAVYGLSIALAVGTVTPLLEIRRALLFLPPPMTRCNFIQLGDQIVGLAHTTKATYLAPLPSIPSPIRPTRAATAPRQPSSAACWDRNWTVSRW